MPPLSAELSELRSESSAEDEFPRGVRKGGAVPRSPHGKAQRAILIDMKKWPEFDSDGDLPVGMHRATLAEVLQHFGRGSLQRRIVEVVKDDTE